MTQGSSTAVRSGSLLGTGVAMLAAVAFLVAAGGSGAAPVARYGGAAWVFLLTWIIMMPVLVPLVRGRAGAPHDAAQPESGEE
ncbi:MAG: hypothetical protein HY660_01095 [Armatimonadetes bacterium]|nr:hypothetical protein [Armatimonadota bacterium]